MIVNNTCLLLLLVFCGLVKFSKCDKDCLYNKCVYKLDPQRYTKHVPCVGTGNRQLTRSVDCEDGLTYHICCKFPFRQDVQKSRQNWFRFVTKSGSKFSIECTKRILCEQACLDGLTGDARSDYPQILNGDSEQNKLYVEAYNKGENQACYGQSENKSYTSKGCVADCESKYKECDKDLESSLSIQAYYKTARVFHKLGMWSFSAWWLIQDTVEEEIDTLNKNAQKLEQVIKKGAENLYERMDRMRNSFKNWAKLNNRRKRSVSETEDFSLYERKWPGFMPIYNETDPKLVDSVNESLSYKQFDDATNIINETLVTYDFKSGAYNFFYSGIYFRFFFLILTVIFPFLINYV